MKFEFDTAAKFKLFLDGKMSEEFSLQEIIDNKVPEEFRSPKSLKLIQVSTKDDNGKSLFVSDIVSVKLPDSIFHGTELIGNTFTAVIEWNPEDDAPMLNEIYNGKENYSHHYFNSDMTVVHLGNYLLNPELVENK